MVALLYIFPILLTLAAVSAFFVNLDAPSGKILFMGAMVVLLILLVGNEATVHMKVRSASELEAQVARVQDWKTGQIAKMNTILASMSSQTETEKEKFASLATLGWSSSNPLLQESYEADAARKELISFMPEAQNKVVIENLPIAVDRMLVSFALEEMGFIVGANQTQSAYEKTTDSNETTSSQKNEDEAHEEGDESESQRDEKNAEEEMEYNYIEYGHLVRNNDIKLVLYTMLRAGVQLKHARVFRKQTNLNSRTIKFSYSKSYRKRSAYTVDKIQKIKAFKR